MFRTDSLERPSLLCARALIFAVAFQVRRHQKGAPIRCIPNDSSRTWLDGYIERHGAKTRKYTIKRRRHQAGIGKFLRLEGSLGYEITQILPSEAGAQATKTLAWLGQNRSSAEV